MTVKSGTILLRFKNGIEWRERHMQVLHSGSFGCVLLARTQSDKPTIAFELLPNLTTLEGPLEDFSFVVRNAEGLPHPPAPDECEASAKRTSVLKLKCEDAATARAWMDILSQHISPPIDPDLAESLRAIAAETEESSLPGEPVSAEELSSMIEAKKRANDAGVSWSMPPPSIEGEVAPVQPPAGEETNVERPVAPFPAPTQQPVHKHVGLRATTNFGEEGVIVSVENSIYGIREDARPNGPLVYIAKEHVKVQRVSAPARTTSSSTQPSRGILVTIRADPAPAVRAGARQRRAPEAFVAAPASSSSKRSGDSNPSQAKKRRKKDGTLPTSEPSDATTSEETEQLETDIILSIEKRLDVVNKLWERGTISADVRDKRHEKMLEESGI